MVKKYIYNLTLFTSFLILVIIIVFTGCIKPRNYVDLESVLDTSKTQLALSSESLENILVPNPPLSLDFYPCSDCHIDLEVNTQRRELVDMHDDIVFEHDSENRWCLACHDANNRDSLRLASGKLLSFKKSYKLCGQCHGPKYRDWKLGIHGKRTGEWNGKKQYLLCVHCHDPHSPKFKQLKPMPPPVRPDQYGVDLINNDENGK